MRGGHRGALGRALNLLYDSAAWIAALFMVGLLAMVLLSIASRLLGFHVPGTDAYAGYLMAGAGFLALAHTLKHGEHIRVTLLVGRLPGRWRRAAELWALGAATLVAALAAWYACRLAWQSHVFDDMSTGTDATPLWIPQLSYALGSVVLLLAFADELVLEALGRRAAPTPDEAARNE